MVQYDYAIISAPALLAGVAGYGFSKMENKKNFPCKCVGFIGVRISVIAFHVASFASVIYAVFKSIVLTSLNIITFNRISCLRIQKIKVDDFLGMLFGANIKKPPTPGIA